MHMYDLIKKKEKFSCEEIESIEDITNQKEYVDEVPQGRFDSRLVACGQDDSYNELENILDSKLESHINNGDITKKQALIALCECCSKIDSPRKRDKFYECLESKLDISIT